MKTVLLSTVAAAALALAGVASAQSNLPSEKSAAPERAPAAQQHAPAEKVAPAMKAGEKKAPSAAQVQKHETTGASSEEKGELKSEKSPTKGEKAPSKVDSKSKATIDSKTNSKVDSKTGATVDSKTKVDTKSNASSDKPGVKNETTAQGSIAAGAKLSTEQRTKIVSVFHQHRVAPAKLNISIRVGARVPANVHFYPVPQEVIVIYPEWRGYDYILVGDEILIINPRTHEIVAILEA
jgi:Protein of unknown function (DUF1236)